jgi:hypothetical protein
VIGGCFLLLTFIVCFYYLFCILTYGSPTEGVKEEEEKEEEDILFFSH